MKYIQKTLALLLALSMLFIMVPAGMTVSAEETAPVTEDIQIPEQTETVDTETTAVDAQIPTIVEKAEIDPWINPLYEGVIDESALNPHVPTADPDASVQATYVSPSAAGTLLRSYMKSRTETVTLYVSSESGSYSTVLEEIVNVAVTHNGKAQEGDYLNFSVAGMEGAYERGYISPVYTFKFDLTLTYTTTAAQEAELTTAVSNLISNLGIRYKSSYEKISAVYDYMCQNITYDYDHLEDPTYLLQFTAYGALINKTAVCEGYALLFYRIMLELGVDCRVVVGIGGDAENNGPHAWNIVEIDGLYYNLDATWDAGYDEYYWFLRNSWNFIYHYRDMAYETISFHGAHPMATEDYTPGVKGEMDPYIFMGQCGDDAIWLLDRYGGLTIVGTGSTYDYDDIEFGWKHWSSEITSVTVEEGITAIGSGSFRGMSALTDVSLPEGLEIIGSYAFRACNALREITLPETLTTMGYGAFYQSEALTSIHFPASLKVIGDEAFYWCTALTEVTMDDGLETIGKYAFRNCNNLEKVTFSGNLKTIKEGAFYECEGLTDIILPYGLETIERDAFHRSYVDSVEIPGTVTSIGPYAFSSVTLEKVVLGEGITTIGPYAFYDACDLEEVVLPSTLTSIGEYAFYHCSLKNFELPYGLTTIEENTFRRAGMTTLTIPETVTTIKANAFNECWRLKEVTIPANVIDLDGFTNCYNLETAYVYSTGVIQPGAFKDCRKMTTLVIGDGITAIGAEAFQNCSALTEVIIPANVTSLGANAFGQCTALATIHFKGQAPEISADAFAQVTADVYYPVGYDTWTEDVMQNYGGTLTWHAAPHDHVYAAVVTEPTCTEQGYTTYTCLYCVENYVADYTDPTGHTPGEVHVENEVPATCTEKGSYDNVTLCAVCGEECGRETIVVDEIPHTPGEVQVENEVAATCTEKGSYDNVTYCTECGAEASRETVETETIPHTYSPVVTEPTCTEQGYTTHTCTVCGDSYVDTYVSALGHTYDNYTLTTKPTQTSTGALTGTCTVCGGTTTVVLPMLNEEDYTYVVTLEPTDDENGAATYTWNITDYGTIIIEVKLRKLTGLPTGDLNDDGEVDIFDANLIVAYYNGTAELDVDQLAAADVNGDGEVDIFDANLVVSHYNGTIDTFPADE